MDGVLPKLADAFLGETASPWTIDVPAYLRMVTEARKR